LDALLCQVTVDDVLPLAVGANVNVYEAVCPAGKVNGKDIPLTENSVPLTLAVDTVTGPFTADTVPL
jgi:hypothetical protein